MIIHKGKMIELIDDNKSKFKNNDFSIKSSKSTKN